MYLDFQLSINKASEREKRVDKLLKRLRAALGSILFCLAERFGSEELTTLRKENKRLEALSGTDALTGLLNRHGEMRVVGEILSILQRAKVPIDMSIIVFDLDRFKQVNDNYGHAAGDTVLGIVAELMRSVCRQTDRLARFGGDEFCIVCLNANPRQAAMVAERLRERIRSHPGLEFDGIGHVTASIGVAAINTGRTDIHTAYLDAKAQADRAVYAAKENGRNIVCYA